MLVVLFRLSNGDEFWVFCGTAWYDECSDDWVCERVLDTSVGDGPMPLLRLDFSSGGCLLSVDLIV